MRGAFREFLGSLRIAEVGVSKGENAKTMMENLPLAKFFLIDSYDIFNPTFQFKEEEKIKVFNLDERERFINQAKLNVADSGGIRCEWIIEDSVEAAKNFPDGYFHFVYLDAEHDYSSVKKDIEAWWPKVKEGWILGGHDYGEDVEKAVREKFTCEINKGYASDWWVIK